MTANDIVNSPDIWGILEMPEYGHSIYLTLKSTEEDRYDQIDYHIFKGEELIGRGLWLNDHFELQTDDDGFFDVCNICMDIIHSWFQDNTPLWRLSNAFYSNKNGEPLVPEYKEEEEGEAKQYVWSKVVTVIV